VKIERLISLFRPNLVSLPNRTMKSDV